MTDHPAAFYTPDGEGWRPTGLGLSPWNPKAQMGVCLGGLAVRALESVPSPVPMLIARLTIDILGAVPMQRLLSATRILREGRRLQLAQSELSTDDGRIWVRATALRVRTEPSPGHASSPTRPFVAGPAAVPPSAWVETIRTGDGDTGPGSGAMWLRFTSTLIEGEALTPLQRIAMAADFGSGTAPLVPMDSWTFANVDISIHLTRPPHGEWLLIDASSEGAGNGVGMTHSRLGDRDGMIGMAHQTTFLARR